MAMIKGMGDFFALDIGTNAIRVVQLTSSGQNNWHLQNYGYVPVDEKITASSSGETQGKLGEAIMTAVGQSGIKTTDVAVGLPSNKTFTTVVDIAAANQGELESIVKYQADQYLPMNADDAKYDWALLGQSLHDPKKQEVLLTSVANSFSESRLDFIEGLGFNVVALEPDPLAMTRSLLPDNMANDAKLIVEVGEVSTDIVIAYGGNPRLVRTVPTGLRSLVKAVVQNLNVKDDQARQFILKFGLAPDKLDGQVFRAVESTLDGFVTEIVKSIKFFQTRYPSTPVGGIVTSGFAAVVPRFGDYLSSKTSVASQTGNPWQRVHVNQNDQQQLAGVASEFATVIGLAQRKSGL